MMIKMLRGWCLLLLCASTPQVVIAEDRESQAEFGKAITAFRVGNFKVASQAFERARKQGLDTPALNYNLGVTYYKLKQYEKARSAFERAALGNRWQALAYYNIGLIAYRQKNNTKAQEYARKVLKLFAGDKLRILAIRLLQLASSPGSSDYLLAQVNAGFGYDSNVALTNNQSVFLADNDSDTFVEVSAQISQNIVGGIYDGLQLYGGIFRTDYQHENEFDLTGLEGGVSKIFQAGSWGLDLGGNWEYLDLDGSPFYRTGEVVIVGTTGNQAHNGLNLTYRLKRFDEGSSDFSYLRGWQTAVAIASAYKFSGFQSRYGYEIKIDRRKDLVLQGEEFSFSPNTHTLFGNLGYQFGRGWQASLNLELGAAQYVTEDVRNGRAPENRSDTFYEIVVQGMREITSSWRAVAELRHLNNRSNLDEFDYTRNIFTISANWRF